MSGSKKESRDDRQKYVGTGDRELCRKKRQVSRRRPAVALCWKTVEHWEVRLVGARGVRSRQTFFSSIHLRLLPIP